MSDKRIQLPDHGLSRSAILAQMEAARAHDVQWRQGQVWSLVFDAGDEVNELAKAAYTTFFSENGLNPTAFPSLRRFETEVVAMVGGLLGGDGQTAGNMTTGGTESILMAVLDCARVGPGRPAQDQPAGDGAAQHGPPRLRQGRPLLRRQGRARAGGRRLPRRRGRHAPGHHAGHGAGGRLGALLPPGRRRSHRRAGRAGPAARDFMSRRRLRGRHDAALRAPPGLPRPRLRLQRAGRDLALGRPAQVRLCGQGRVGDPLSQPGAAPPPALRHHRLAGRHLRLAHHDRHAAGRRDRRGLGGAQLPGRWRATSASPAR